MKFKRSLTFLLALAMLFTALPVLPLAATPTAAELLADYGNKFGGFSGTIDASNAEERVPAASAILTAYAALPNDAARDALGSNFFYDLNTLLYYYLRYVEGSSVATSAYISNYIEQNIATQKMADARALARLIYGGTEFAYTKTDSSAGSIKFAIATDFTNADNQAAYVQFLEVLKAADPLVQDYIGLFGSTYTYATILPQSSILVRAFTLHVNYLMGSTPGLARDAAVLKALQEYDGLGQKFSDGFRLALEAKTALEQYEASGEQMSSAPFAGLQAKADALTRAATRTVDGLSTTSATTGYPMGTVNGKTITPYHALGIAARSNVLLDVFDAMHSFDFDKPSNDLIKRVRGGMESMITTFRGLIQTPTFVALYDRILASYQSSLRPGRDDSIPSKEGYVKAKVEYPKNMSKLRTSLRFCALEPLAAIAVEVMAGSAEALYTNATVSTLAGLNGIVYDMLKEEAGSDWTLLQALILRKQGAVPDTQSLAKHLTEEPYADAKAKLEALADWSEYRPEEYTWGVTDGDRESFVTAATAVLRPIAALLYYNALIQDKYDSYGDFASDGTYETAVLPMLEALGCRGVIPADDFMQQALALPGFTTGVNGAYGKQQDALAQALLNPLLNLLEDVMQNPLPMLLDLLPRLAYAEQAGDLEPFFRLIFDFSLTTAEFMPFKSLQALVDMLAPALPIALPGIDWAYLAHMGSLEHQPSVNGKYVYKNFVTADREDVFTYLLNGILEQEGNKEIIGDMLLGAVGISAKAADILAMQAAFQSGKIADGAKLLFSIAKGLFQKKASPEPCCEDKEACGCTCGEVPADDCPCTCEACEPAPEEEPGLSLSTGEILKLFFRFARAYAKNVAQFAGKLLTGKIARA